MAKLFGGGDLFDQVKFALGLGTFVYAVWSIWGNKVGIGEPPWVDDLGGVGDIFGGEPDLAVRATPNCDSKTKMCACPDGDVFQMGAARSCSDCTEACGMPQDERHDPGSMPVESNVAWYYGRPIRDHGLGWTLSDFGENDPKNRLTVA